MTKNNPPYHQLPESYAAALADDNYCVLWLSETGQLLQTSSCFRELAGYPDDAANPSVIYEIIPHLSMLDWRKLWQEVKGNGAKTTKFQVMTADGNLKDAVFKVLLFEVKGQEVCCMITKSQQKKANEKGSAEKKDTKSAEQNSFFETILRHCPLPVLCADKTGRVFYANTAWSDSFGDMNSSEAIDDLNVYDVWEGTESVKEWNVLRNQIKNTAEDFYTFETTALRRNGDKYSARIKANYVIDDSKKDFICFYIRDLTERREQEEELRVALDKNLKLNQKLSDENKILRSEIVLNSSESDNIITRNDSYRRMLEQLQQVAETEATVLISGETGTGKELLAKALHGMSRRSEQPIISVNCAALPEGLIESELFGHEKGAFTGAYQTKQGRFEIADKGTIFLDEIGEMPMLLQAKLLRVLQEGEFERVGGTKTHKTNVRVVTATNRDLLKMVEEGTFREDLYYRLNVFPIYNIPLRERKDDIPLLVEHFLRKYSKKIGRDNVTQISKSGMAKMIQYDFPGNVRELENMVERALILSKGKVLNLDLVITPDKRKNKPTKQNIKTLEELQRDHIISVLKKTNWRIGGPSGAARLLGMNDKTLYSKIQKMRIQRQK